MGRQTFFPALPRAPSWVALTRGLCYCLLLRPHRNRVAAPHWRLRHVRNLRSRPRLSHGYRLPPAASLKPLHNGTNERDNVRRAALRFTSQPNGYGMHFPGPARFVQNPFVLVLSVEIQYRPRTHAPVYSITRALPVLCISGALPVLCKTRVGPYAETGFDTVGTTPRVCRRALPVLCIFGATTLL